MNNWQEELFLKIIKREEPATILYEDDKVIAFLDKYAHTKGHFLVVPKNYSRNLFSISDEDLSYLIVKAREFPLQEIKKLGATGFKLLINNEPDAEQSIFHTHVHIIPYYKK
ncbi:histidine triad protein HinT [Mesomycoplasma hyorhinis]|uniref:histidine triad protein HinT n=1 Tax=Mesomycoplasma hyorhinis TaxID=2100 RepID=UPI001C04CF3B|nr:HIT domain-containing protein [Mesomycoplasma hyorhinis]